MRCHALPAAIPVLALLAAACTDARGFNAYEAICVDQRKMTPGTEAFRACAAQEEANFVDEVRRRKGSLGSP